ncbi:ArsR family transcriptional regulator [Halobacteriales archaeon QS_1_68_20]|nr:MAG: ArsR family transcriptional regulator [Halobacteriales archaeon QS_1_68_20]
MTGSDGEDGVVVDRLSPEESFERLAHDIRLQTILTLDDDGPLSHAALRERVGVDDPGQFNYHLRKLDGRFVRDDGDGYDLTAAGRRVVGAVLSGGYTADLAGDTVPADADCLRCGGPLETHLAYGGVYVTCNECGQTFNDVEMPPSALEGSDPSEIYGLVDRWAKRRLTAAQYGFCHRCDGPIDQRVRRATEDVWEEGIPGWLADLPVEAVLEHRCTRCEEQRYSLVAAVAALEPAVASFHHEHGVDVRETPLTDLDWLEMGVTTVESTDPLVVTVPVTLDDETLVVSFDADFSLVDERRR